MANPFSSMQNNSRGSRLNRFRLSDPQYLLAQALSENIKTGPAKGGWTEGLSRLGQAWLAKDARDEAMGTFEASETDRSADYDRIGRAMKKEWRNPDFGNEGIVQSGNYKGLPLNSIPGEYSPIQGGGTPGAVMSAMMRGKSDDIRSQGMGMLMQGLQADRAESLEKAKYERKREDVLSDQVIKSDLAFDNEQSRRVWEDRKADEKYKRDKAIAKIRSRGSNKAEIWRTSPTDPKVLESNRGNRKLDPSKKPVISAGQKALDVAFGKEYEKTYASGGIADAQKNLSQLRSVKDRLDSIAAGESEENLTGPVLGRVPDFVKSITNPAAIDTREQVEEVVQRNLRVILGAQFTEKEGTRLIARAYNPNLEEKENSARLGRLITAMGRALAAKNAAAKYFEENDGTLAGYKWTPTSVRDLEQAIEGDGGWSIKKKGT